MAVSAASPAVALGRDRRRPAVAVVTLAVLVAAGAARGSYFPGSWGWLALVCAWLAAVVLVVAREEAPTRAGVALVLSATGLGAWTALSGLWSSDPTQSGLEAQRTLVYAAALLALVVAGREAGAVLAGAWAAATLLAGWGVLTRLLPERLGVDDAIAGYRLAEPIGYWNALGLLAGMGALLALGLAARGRGPMLRATAAASLVPLGLALYFTFSRGAWIALAGGLVASFALDRARLHLLATLAVCTPPAAAAVALASRSHALVTVGAQLADRSREGHRLLLAALLLALAAAGLALALAAAERRVAVGAGARRAAAAALATGAVAAIAAITVAYGAPWTIVRHGWTTFATASPSGEPNLNTRLFSVGGNGRVAQWHVAVREVEQHPWLGGGAGTYEQYWRRYRATTSKVRDVHNLYLETLAELGPVGLALLAALLAAPLAAALRARRRPLGAVAAGAYVAYLLHVVVDWDWEIASVTLVALACGAALVCSGRPTRLSLRRAGIALAVVLAAASVYTIATRLELARESTAAARGDWTAAAADARGAARLAPWSTEPWQRLGEAELAAGRYEAARLDLRRALRRNPGGSDLWLDLARASGGTQRVQAMAEARRLDPHSLDLAAFVETLRSLGRIQAARP